MCDFTYIDKERGLIIADSKGMLTPEYKVKREWLLHQYNGFVFVEFYKDFVKEYEPIGDIEIIFKK